ncbi:MAG: helix-turn-helix domain-containing protein [Treponema sp.]|jgi:excisionase family DNA binding protein|nr:helix-turn-helix domain-containing protein [Treponema sp.]
MEKPLTVSEAANYLSLAKTYIYKLVSQGKLTAFNPGGRRLYFRREDLENYVLQGRRYPSEELLVQADAILNRED